MVGSEECTCVDRPSGGGTSLWFAYSILRRVCSNTLKSAGFASAEHYRGYALGVTDVVAESLTLDVAGSYQF